MDTDQMRLDGNAAGGVFASVFGVEMTTATVECPRCHDVNELARMMLYDRAPGRVLRCPSCGDVVVRIVEAPGRTLVEIATARTTDR